MKKLTIGLVMLLLCIGFGCSKSGPAGPAGPAGKDGAKGANGVNGINGKDGATILSGKGKPTAGLGKNGDFYLDLTTSMLYGPKTAYGWGTGYNMKGKDGVNGKDGINGTDGKEGKDGANGKDGKNGRDGVNGTDGKDGKDGKDGTQILNGYGYPGADLGNMGDFYIDLNDFTLYGPKISGTDWGMTGIMLRGTNGADGKDGVDGKDANVRTYIISNPWTYYYTAVPTMGLFRFILQGNFDISAYEADYGLVLVYMECAWADNSTSWLMAGTNLGSFSSNFISSAEVVESYGAVNGVYLTTTNRINGSSGWTDQAEAQSVTKISRIKIVVVSPSTVYVMGKKGIDTKNVQAVGRYLNLK